MEKAKIFLWAQSAVCIITVIMLSVAAIGVYNAGKARRAEDPTAYIYTPEGAKEAAAPGVIVLYAGIGISICGWLLGIRDEKADKPVKDTECMRDITISKIAEPSKIMMEEHILQQRLKRAGWVVFGICMIPVFIYLVNPSHFAQSSQEGLEHVIGSMVLHILPWIVIGFGFLVSSAIQQERCMERECEAASIRLKEEKEAGITPKSSKTAVKQMTDEKLKKIRIVILVLAVIFIIAGIANGNMHAVMVKAINICTECVGLG